MHIRKLLLLQVIYCLLGLGYNLVSYILISKGAPPLSATAPLVGAVSMLVYGICLAPGFLGAHRVYRVLMAAAIIVYGYGGVIKHLLNMTQEGLAQYHSLAAWAFAMGINVFGLILNILAVAGKFRRI
jgi:hypothetical protein